MFVKVCGTTSEEDALLAVAMGVDAIGFVFAASPRQIAPAAVADIVKRLPSEIVTVGVFRDEAPARVVDIVTRAGLRGAQLHGHETPEITAWVSEHVPLVIKAFVAGDRGVKGIADYQADALLLDSPNPGSGQIFDWRLADGVPDGSRLIIAGGLTPDNVADAIAAVHPWGVDVVTGVESAPGRKDPRKLLSFVTNARAAFERAGDTSSSFDSTPAPYDWADDDVTP